MLYHLTWAVGSYMARVSPAADISQSKSTEGFYHPDVSTCMTSCQRSIFSTLLCTRSASTRGVYQLFLSFSGSSAESCKTGQGCQSLPSPTRLATFPRKLECSLGMRWNKSYNWTNLNPSGLCARRLLQCATMEHSVGLNFGLY